MKRRNWPTRIVSLSATIAFIWLAYIAAGRITGWYIIHKFSVDSPNIGVMPKAMQDTSVATLTGIRLEQFGFSFQVPWTDEPARRDGTSVLFMSFRDGRGLIVFNPATQLDAAKLMQTEMLKSSPESARMWNASTLKSNYDLMSAELRSDPGRFVPWAAKDEFLRGSVLLPLKAGLVGEATAVYEMNLGPLRGFQFGDPHTEKKIHLELFDAADRHYSIIISGKLPLASSISQSEINALVASIHPMPPPASTSQRFPG